MWCSHIVHCELHCKNDLGFDFRLKPIVESNLREIFLMERELSTLLAKGFNEDTESGIHHCR